MKALFTNAFRSELLFGEVPKPVAGPNEVLVRIYAAGLNPFDWKVANGALEGSTPHSFPLVIGNDGAGVVAATGDGVTGFAPGDRVFGQFMNVAAGSGSFAEYGVAKAGKLALIPEGVSFTTAAALPTASLTAEQAVAAVGVQPGTTILINGASGGVGQSAIQIAVARGAKVIATGTSDITAYLGELGAADVIDFKNDSVSQQLMRRNVTVDSVIDLVSNTPEEAGDLVGLLTESGAYLSTNGAADVPALEATARRGFNLYTKTSTESLTAIIALVDADKLKVRVNAEVPLEMAAETVAAAQKGPSRGKTVISI